MEERGGAWESNGEKGGATVIEQQFKKIGKINSSLEGYNNLELVCTKNIDTKYMYLYIFVLNMRNFKPPSVNSRLSQ